MASLIVMKHFLFLAAAVFSLPTLCYSQQYPGEVVAKALLCFNKQLIYNRCQESYRLNEIGNLNVPPEATNEYCNGPCLDETQLVLNCVDGILKNFVFYNRATIRDVRSTLRSACSYGSQRGDFNVAEHIQDEYGGANKPVVAGLVTSMVGVVMIFIFLL